MGRGTTALCAVVLAALTFSAGCGAKEPASLRGCAVDRAALVPADGAWFGVALDWRRDSLAGYAHRLAETPALVLATTPVPWGEEDRAAVARVVAQARSRGTMLLLTLEPRQGLVAVTEDVAEEVARTVDGIDREGVPVFVRFAPDMNGSWEPWGQEPIRYVKAFRRVAQVVHRLAPGSPMMWAPSYGGGYPFHGGRYETRRGTLGAEALDVDGDGEVTQADDPYAPYWPGKDAVDWVGMSLYDRGSRFPGGENEVPEPGVFVDLLRGRYDGKAGDETAVPDFYARYAEDQGRPVAVTETAARYASDRGGAWPLAVKRSWWQQVFRARADGLPMVRMVDWYERDEHPLDPEREVDWSVTRSPTTLAPFRRDLPPWLQFAEDVPRCR